MAVLPHPCYVYAVCFTNSDGTDQLVFTGAYDNAIRVWSIASDSHKVYVPIEETLQARIIVLYGFS